MGTLPWLLVFPPCQSCCSSSTTAAAATPIRRLTTETGAGQWGASLAFACSLFDMECEIFQVPAAPCCAALRPAAPCCALLRCAVRRRRPHRVAACAWRLAPWALARRGHDPHTRLAQNLPPPTQVRASYDSKPYRRMLMELWGATCYPSPSTQTQARGGGGGRRLCPMASCLADCR